MTENLKHDNNYHKYIRDEIDSLKRGQTHMIKKMDDILKMRDQVRDNTRDIRWMKKAGIFIAGILGLKGFIIK